MVVAIMGADQLHNGRLVARAGAGLALTNPDAGALRAAIQSVVPGASAAEAPRATQRGQRSSGSSASPDGARLRWSRSTASMAHRGKSASSETARASCAAIVAKVVTVAIAVAYHSGRPGAEGRMRPMSDVRVRSPEPPQQASQWLRGVLDHCIVFRSQLVADPTGS